MFTLTCLAELVESLAYHPHRDEHQNREGELPAHMIKVRPRPNEPVQQLMRRLKKLCEREGVLREMKRTAYYEKPSDRKRRSMRKSKRRVGKFDE